MIQEWTRFGDDVARAAGVVVAQTGYTPVGALQVLRAASEACGLRCGTAVGFTGGLFAMDGVGLPCGWMIREPFPSRLRRIGRRHAPTAPTAPGVPTAPKSPRRGAGYRTLSTGASDNRWRTWGKPVGGVWTVLGGPQDCRWGLARFGVSEWRPEENLRRTGGQQVDEVGNVWGQVFSAHRPPRCPQGAAHRSGG